jgi:hypothetical protein
MGETFIFDIPIYRVDEASYYTDRDSYVDECLHEHPELSRSEREVWYDANPELRIRDSDYHQRQYGGPWRFNDVIGYLRLYLNGYQVRGQLWYVDVKRISRNPRHKRLFCKNSSFGVPVDISPDSSNRDIFDHIMQYVDSVRPRLKNRVMDVALFETVGPHIDWKSLISGA